MNPNTVSDEALYEQAMREAESGQVRAGLWAKAFAEADGEANKQKALYILYRVRQEQECLESAKKADHPESSPASTAFHNQPALAKPGLNLFTRHARWWAVLLLGSSLFAFLVPQTSAPFPFATNWPARLGMLTALIVGPFFVASMVWLFGWLIKRGITSSQFMSIITAFMLLLMASHLLVYQWTAQRLPTGQGSSSAEQLPTALNTGELLGSNHMNTIVQLWREYHPNDLRPDDEITFEQATKDPSILKSFPDVAVDYERIKKAHTTANETGPFLGSNHGNTIVRLWRKYHPDDLRPDDEITFEQATKDPSILESFPDVAADYERIKKARIQTR